MGKYCEVCGKGTLNGNNVSHSERKTHTTWAPNVQKVRVVVNGGGGRQALPRVRVHPLPA